MKDSSRWASEHLGQEVTTSNISYLLQYGLIKKHGNNGNPLIDSEDLRQYYKFRNTKELWKKKLGEDLNWQLSFTEYRESERTKHVHRLHPYKGKFIPQLVEYFLDGHTDAFKRKVYFHPGDIILDPFCGSGTTLVQANELGMHAIGMDISSFNSMISNVKVTKHDIPGLIESIGGLTLQLDDFQKCRNNRIFEKLLLHELAVFNGKYFPYPQYRRKVREGKINERKYAKEKEQIFLKTYKNLVRKNNIQVGQNGTDSFLDTWFLFPVREEIDFMINILKKIDDKKIQKILAIILSRTVRSCRATTHADLGTLREPVTTTYYCKKHGKICKPIFSIYGWWKRYTIDTINRLIAFNKRRTDTLQICLTGDSKTMDVHDAVKKRNPELARLLREQKLRGIFSSPPYVGLIDYHEQHAYSYEMFGFDRKDKSEIGPLSQGQGKEAKNSYAAGIADSLRNCKKHLQQNYDVFLVANDKHNLYPGIAEKAGMKIVNQFKRPVLNRVEKDRTNAYSEIIFHLKEK